MPQLDISTFLPQLFWLVIWFGLLYWLMSRVGLPRIEVAIEARKRQREDDLARAARFRAEAEAASAAFQKTMADARAQAQAVIKETSDRLAAEAAERQRVLSASLAEQIAAAEQRIAASKTQALAEMRGIALDVGRSVVEKLIGGSPDNARITAAVDRQLARQVH